MFRLIIFLLLFVTIKLTMHCGEHTSTTKGQLKRVLYEVDSKFNGKVGFTWQTCRNVPTSKYLPIRAGTSTDRTRFEVALLNMNGVITGKFISKYEIQIYRMLFYIYVTWQSTVLRLYVEIKYTNKIYIQVNRNKIKSIDVDKDSRCLTKFKYGCKFKIEKLKSRYKKNILWISMLNGWNQIKFSNILWKTYYLLHIYNPELIKHRSFIPWNTTLPTECAKWDQYISRNLYKVNYFELNMDFTYGQMDGLNTVLSCFKKIVSENNIKVKIDGVYITKYKTAKFELSGTHSAKNEFYKLLVDRKKSAKCIEYICIHWNMDVSEHVKNNASKPNNNASKPNNNASKPNNNASKPNNNASKPNNNASKPNNNASKPNNNASKPNNNASKPNNNNASKPNNNASKPNNNASKPNNNASKPNKNNASKPNNNASKPNNNNASKPNNNNASKPNNNNASKPNNNASKPNNNASKPNNNASTI